MDFRRNWTTWRRALRLCAKHGIPLVVTSTKKRFTGRVSAHVGMGVDEILHEAAHWLCATPDRRLIYNYGLGDPNDEAEPQFMAVSLEESEAEEIRVSVMGMALMLRTGVSVANVKIVMWEHNWRFASIVEMRETIRQLVELDPTGVVVKHEGTLLRLHRELVDEERAEREAQRHGENRVVSEQQGFPGKMAGVP